MGGALVLTLTAGKDRHWIMSTARRTVGVFSRKRPLGPNGERLCYQCLGPLPKGKRFNCSAECSEKWRIRTSPSHMRYVLWQRDKGVCALCGVDCDALKEEYRKRSDQAWRNDFLKVHGIPAGRRCTDWWDADHIVPVIEGGGECTLENLRTLCLPCHKKETAQLAARRSRKPDPPPEEPQAGMQQSQLF